MKSGRNWKVYEKRNWQIHYQNMEWSDLFLSIIINKHPLQFIFFSFFAEFTQITWPKNITLQSEKILRREEKSQTLEEKIELKYWKVTVPRLPPPSNQLHHCRAPWVKFTAKSTATTTIHNLGIHFQKSKIRLTWAHNFIVGGRGQWKGFKAFNTDHGRL